MNPGYADSVLSVIFIDFDNIYLSLKSRSEEAAARFARQPALWYSQIVNGRLIKSMDARRNLRRRVAVARCYGNPEPWRQGRNGQHDPNCFAFVRHNFMRAGMEVVDCPKVTSQFKNCSDIRIACDVRDFLEHKVRFDEFIIMSGDSDFTPVLWNLRSSDRRRVIYTNEHTSPYYSAYCDGWVEEKDLIGVLLQAPALEAAEQPREIGHERAAPGVIAAAPRMPQLQAPDSAAKARHANFTEGAVQSLIADFKIISEEIIQHVVDVVDRAHKPVPLAYLADRAQKALGQQKTIGTNWAGCNGFLNFLVKHLPQQYKISERPPQVVYNPALHAFSEPSQPAAAPPSAPQPRQEPARPHEALQQQAGAQGAGVKLAELKHSVNRIYEACQAPPLPPSEYQLLFTLIAAEVKERGFRPLETAAAVVARARDAGLSLALKDVSFVLEAVDEIDPWLDKTQSASAVARAYRDYVLARCNASGIDLTEDEHQLIQVWFGASQWTPAAGGDSPAGGGSGGGGLRGGGRGQLSPFRARVDRGIAEARGLTGPAQPPASDRGDPALPPEYGYGGDDDQHVLDKYDLTSALRLNFSKRH